MGSTFLYGYVPTHWIAILFALSCLFTLCTMIPALFFRYRNVALGIFIVAGLVFQLAGHTCMTVSSFLPKNVPAWITQRLAFSIGKLCSRVAVYYVYYAALCRIPNAFPKVNSENRRPEHEIRSFMCSYICAVAICGHVLRFIVQGIEIGAVVKGSMLFPDAPMMATVLSIISSGFLLLTTTSLAACLVMVICRTRNDIPWFKMTWMMGYYVTLQIVPVFVLTQDIYDLVKCFFSHRNEMLELTCDMGMTKSILIMLGGQTYEIAYSWSQKRPKVLENIELQVKEILELRHQVHGNNN